MGRLDEQQNVVPESAKGYHEGGESLPEGLERLIFQHHLMKLMGDVIAFSSWDDEYMQKFVKHLVGRFRFRACCTAWCCRSYCCHLCWCEFCWRPRLTYRHVCDFRSRAERLAREEAIGYHIIFPNDYVWLKYEARSRNLEMISIIPIRELTGALSVASIDRGMPGVCGCIWDAMVPDMPGVLIKALVFNDEGFCPTWTDEYGKFRASLDQKDKEKYSMRKICDPDAFAAKVTTQVVWCKENAPPAQQSMEDARTGEYSFPLPGAV